MGIGEQRRIKAVVLGAGRGERLRPLTDKIPKPLISIGSRPLLAHWSEALGRVGVTQALINIHHLADVMCAGIADLNRQGPVRWTVSEELQLLGTAGAIRANATWMDDADCCLVIYADNYSSASLEAFLDFHWQGGSAMTLGLFRTPTPRQCGIVDLDAEGQVTSFQEKPQNPRSDLAFAGLIAMSADAYKEVARSAGTDFGHDILPGWVGRARGWMLNGYHIDIGTPDGLEKARKIAGQHKNTDESEEQCVSY